MCRVISEDRKWNEYIRGSIEVPSLVGKLKENRLGRWLGHVSGEIIQRVVMMEMIVDGKTGEKDQIIDGWM